MIQRGEQATFNQSKTATAEFVETKVKLTDGVKKTFAVMKLTDGGGRPKKTAVDPNDYAERPEFGCNIIKHWWLPQFREDRELMGKTPPPARAKLILI